MLFPGSDPQLKKLVIGFALGTIITSVAVVFLALVQAGETSAMSATATATKTATRPPTATSTATATPSPSATPTKTSTPTPTATETNTATPTVPATPTDTPTPVPPTATPIEALTNTLVISSASTPIAVTSLTSTLVLTSSVTQTTTLTVTPVGTPTPTPTPVPRTVQVPDDFPDFTQAEDHFWFTRPFSNTFQTWGSYYYPYGTNGRGQYFWHFGVDIQNPQYTPILAAGDGTIIYAGPDLERPLGPWPDFYGQAVVIEHDRRWNDLPVYTLYGHVSEVLVQVGQSVKAGDPIALVGQLGVALGPHLHLEVRVGAGTYYNTRNPDFWVRPDPGFGVVAGRVVDHEGYFVPQQLVTLHRAETPSKFWRQTFTYPDNVVNFDDAYGETFSFSDVPAGRYLVKTAFDGHQLTIPVTVSTQRTTFVLLEQTQPPKINPPAPTATPAELSAESDSEQPTAGAQ